MLLRMLKLSILFLAVLLLLSLSDHKIISMEGREVININKDWLYLESNEAMITDVIKSDISWEQINLPHTWNQWDPMDMAPGYRRDQSWYKKTLFIKDIANATYELYFEGVNISSTIYVNGNLAGEHIGGYVGFTIDISKWVKKGKENDILVRVDNSYNPDIIPSQKADFFIYGGITRDVWLRILPQVHIDHARAKCSEVSKTSAKVSVDLSLDYAQDLNDQYSIYARIVDPLSNKAVSEISIRGSKYDHDQAILLPLISNPKLWSPDQPYLYQLETTIMHKDKLVDQTSESIGFRWFHFDDKGAFFLNGEQLLLRGTHRHEEHAGYGAAMPNHLHRQDIQSIKDMGANFLRLGHYPQDPEVYKACNELGIIVWDEIPWCRGGMGNETWQKNTKSLLTQQILQNFNHPSILFWSLGNEIYWLPDFENGDDTDRLNTYLKKLNDLAHELDNTRMTAIRKYYAGSDIVDVFSPSIWSGWYAGVYKNYAKTLTANQKKYPHFLHMEYGGSSHVGRHTENPITGDGALNEDDWAEVSNQVDVVNVAKSGDWTENYIVDLFDWYLGVSETQENFAGNAQWAFKDFGTPLRPENAIPYVNQKGLVDRNGKPKDAYYVFKSYWSNDPFTYIESHSWTERRGPEGKARNVSVFSNCENVELLHNGKSLGTKQRELGNFPACGLSWDIQFTAGKNELIALGRMDNKQVYTDTLNLNYEYTQAGSADHIVLSYKTYGEDKLLIEAHMMDKNGIRVLDYEKPLYFTLNGAGELYKNYGTPTRSQVIQMANGYAAIELKTSQRGVAILEARNQDFKGSYLTINFEEL